ncbi:MAG TPA: phage holin family protein [Terriglobales bacterium]|nr:phage holin family protein [Terriglobales bacterium]
MNLQSTPPDPNARGEAATTMEMLRELMQEAVGYGRDLLQLFSTELNEKARSIRVLAGMVGAALLFLLFSFCWLSLALIGVISYGLDSWRWALLIVGVAYAIIGLLLLIPVAHGVKSGLFRFDNTQRRLKEDTKYVKTKLAA